MENVYETHFHCIDLKTLIAIVVDGTTMTETGEQVKRDRMMSVAMILRVGVMDGREVGGVMMTTGREGKVFTMKTAVLADGIKIPVAIGLQNDHQIGKREKDRGRGMGGVMGEMIDVEEVIEALAGTFLVYVC